MMIKKAIVYLASVLCILWVTGCKQLDEKFISEGRIDYTVNLVDKQNDMANMIPHKMTIKFKDDKSAATMIAGMGLFSTSFISDPESKTYTICLKLLDKKMAAVQTEADIAKENNNYPYDFISTKETKMIAGYKCFKVHVKPKKEGQLPFDIFYTNQLNIHNPNFANPFYKIDGVLMEYQIKKLGFELHFVATAVVKEPVDDEVFKYSSDYKMISDREMNDIFKDLD